MKSFGLIPELIGRMPVLTHLDPLDAPALKRILTEPKNAIIRQYKKLFAMDGIELKVQGAALDFIVEQAVEHKLGARGLRSICEAILIDAMYELPSKKNTKASFSLTAAYAKKHFNKNHLKQLKAVSQSCLMYVKKV